MIYDGIQRPLEIIRDQTGSFIARGRHRRSARQNQEMALRAPRPQPGQFVSQGDIIGWVQETPGDPAQDHGPRGGLREDRVDSRGRFHRGRPRR
jgi:hypothetical protein